MNTCIFRGCTRERHPDIRSQGRCGECWQADDENENYQKRWYDYWNSRGKNYKVVITPRRFAV